MDNKAILGNNDIEDVRWLCSLSESEIDLLMSLKMLILQRAKVIGHDALTQKFDLRLLRVLAFILMEHLKGQLKDLPLFGSSTEALQILNGCNLLKVNQGSTTNNMSIEELRDYFCTDKRKRIAEMFSEDTVPRQKRKIDPHRAENIDPDIARMSSVDQFQCTENSM